MQRNTNLLSTVYTFVYCLILSALVVGSPMIGGCLLLTAQSASMLSLLFQTRNSSLKHSRIKLWFTATIVILLLFMGGMIVAYPGEDLSTGIWAVFAMEILIFARDVITARFVHLYKNAGISAKRCIFILSAVELLCCGCALLTLRNNTESAPLCYYLLLGYVISCAISLYSTVRTGTKPLQILNISRESIGRIWKANSIRIFELLSGLLMASQVITLVLLFSVISTIENGFIFALILALLTTVLGWELSELLYRRLIRRKQKTSDMSNLLILGIILWLYGLLFFLSQLRNEATLVGCLVCLSAVALGCILCLSWTGKMMNSMKQAADFAAGEDASAAFDATHSFTMGAGVLLGEVLSLVLMVIHRGQNPALHPLMILPAVAAVAASLILALRFPLSRKDMAKLSRFLSRKTAGDNRALKRQLSSVVVEKHTQPFAVRFLTWFVRKILKHKLINAENIHEDPDNPVIFLSNHSEMYGPIAAMANIPVDVRPWTMSELTVSAEEMAEYFYRYTVSQQKWIPKGLQMPVAKMIAPLCIWGMRQLESIPVFRNKLSQLKTTFRLSVEALQAGDNLLIFPENPNAHYDGEGYVIGGVGELFTGFAMLAPIYFNMTGKRARFLPMFCSLSRRQVIFGNEIQFDPEAEPMAERDRIVSSAKQQMDNMCKGLPA